MALQFSYNYVKAALIPIDFDSLAASLSAKFIADNRDVWIKKWLFLLKNHLDKQMHYLSNRTNLTRVSKIFDESFIEFFPLIWQDDTNKQRLYGFINISKLLEEIRLRRPKPLQMDISLLVEHSRILWQSTDDLKIQLSNTNQPIIAYPLLEGEQYILSY